MLPLSQWRGYRDTSPPPPDPATLGAPERVLEPIEAAVIELTHGQRKASLTALEIDPRDVLAIALAGLGRASEEGEAGKITGVHKLPRKTTPDLDSTHIEQFAAPGAAPQPPADDIEAVKRHWLRALLGPDGGG